MIITPTTICLIIMFVMIDVFITFRDDVFNADHLVNIFMGTFCILLMGFLSAYLSLSSLNDKANFEAEYLEKIKEQKEQ